MIAAAETLMTQKELQELIATCSYSSVKLALRGQLRGKPVTRIPIMAKQVLDLYELYRLVVQHGGLVEIINKKLWREITKGLNLPSSITSAAFTLRTQ
ncbi:ARID/BRIGHT DNA binding domain protein [Oesophagostomum dentatum]|uniref:ARID/BRIGHT DNA binding domain protein n=1 Tax=Oesophagostomum dentatum TaxID=61180 RepID=A0A0B1S7U9_OESDE|nr:ARID/BRIGHT DNA binding domain protein [Oesophagostomum dentatum]